MQNCRRLEAGNAPICYPSFRLIGRWKHVAGVSIVYNLSGNDYVPAH